MNVSQFMQYLMANNIGKILNSKTANLEKIEASLKRFNNTAVDKFRLIITENLPAIYLVDVELIVNTFINVFDPNSLDSSTTYKQVLKSFTINNVPYNIRDLYTEESLEDSDNYDIMIHAIHLSLWQSKDRLVKSILTMLSSKVSKTIDYSELAKEMSKALDTMNSAKNAFGILESMSGEIDTTASKSVVTQNLNRSIASAGRNLQAYYAKHTPSKIKNPHTIIANYDPTKHLLLFGATFDELKTFINTEINGSIEVLLTKGIGGKSLFAKGTSISFEKYGYTEDYGFVGNRGNTKFLREQAQKERGQVIGVSVGNLVAAGHTAAVSTNNGATKVLAINTPLTIKTMLALDAENAKAYDVSEYVSSTPHLKHALQFTKEAAGSTEILAKGLLQFVVSMETNYNSVYLGPIEKAEIDKQTVKLINKKTDEITSEFIKTLSLPKTLRIMVGALRWSPTILENVEHLIINTLRTGTIIKGKKASASTTRESIFKGINGSLKGVSFKSNTKAPLSIPIKTVNLKTPIPSKIRNKSGQFTSLVSIQTLLNAALATKIKENMGTPALNNRTGRFAESVKVDRLSESRAGMITAFYSYMKSPYQTFEPGFAQGSEKRNPKTLISKSIRDIAATAVGNRLRAVSI